jgi:hypothetical protein
MIDIDILLSTDKAPALEIPLESDTLELPTLIMDPVPSNEERERIFNKHFHPVITLQGKSKRKRKEQQTDIEMKSSNLAYACDMAEYITGWKGTKSTFSVEKIKALFRKFSVVADAFSEQIQDAFEAYEEAIIKKAEVLEKN